MRAIIQPSEWVEKSEIYTRTWALGSPVTSCRELLVTCRCLPRQLEISKLKLSTAAYSHSRAVQICAAKRDPLATRRSRLVGLDLRCVPTKIATVAVGAQGSQARAVTKALRRCESAQDPASCNQLSQNLLFAALRHGAPGLAIQTLCPCQPRRILC